MGAGLRRRRVGVPAGPRVRQHAPRLARAGAEAHRSHSSSDCRSSSSSPGTTATAASSASRTPEFAILTLLLLLGGGAFWYYQRASDAETTAVAEGSKQSTAAPEAGVLRLAVLPLENLSPDPANAFFADGLHDEILSAMSATRDLQVVSRTTMRTYAGTHKTVKQIATELGASHVLEGAVRRAGDQVRLTLQLIDAATDSNVWSRTFDRQLRDALSLQSEVAKEVATALDVQLIPADDRAKDGGANLPTTTNPVAYDLYLKGKLQLDTGANGQPE